MSALLCLAGCVVVMLAIIRFRRRAFNDAYALCLSASVIFLASVVVLL